MRGRRFVERWRGFLGGHMDIKYDGNGGFAVVVFSDLREEGFQFVYGRSRCLRMNLAQ